MVRLNKAVIGGSIILLIAFNLYNFLNFLFQFIMARMLTPAEYGILAALFSITYILGIFSESVQTLITKYSAVERSDGKIKNLLKRALRKSYRISFAVYIVYLLISIALTFILEIDYLLLAINGLVIATAFSIPITRGVLQGKKMFNSLGINLIIESSLKLILAVIFIALLTLSWPLLKLYGAVLAIPLSSIAAFSLSIFALRKIFHSKEGKMESAGIYSQTPSVFFVTLAVIAFYSLDIIVARAVFSAEIAGYYAIASILSKALFWGTQPISKAMFPVSSTKGKSSSPNAFSSAFILLIAGILAVLAIFYLFPDLIIRIFSGKYIPESASILIYVSLAMAILAFANLILLYKISKGIVKGYLYLPVILLIEITLLIAFSQTLLSFSLSLLASAIIFLIGALLLVRR